MSNKKNLTRLSLILLAFNLALGLLAVYNSYFQHTPSRTDTPTKNSRQVLGATSIPKFDQNYIISNQTFSSTKAFGAESDVQNYLNKVNSPLKNYSVQGKAASSWVFAAARGQSSSKWGIVPNLNPGLLLTLLEKEQSLMSLSNYDAYTDADSRIKYATGYGCPDGDKCDEQYTGFVNQINWAAYQLQFNYNNAVSGQYVAPFKVNNTISTLDEFNVFLSNEATAALYRYTPHVCPSSYNLWKIMVSNGWGLDNNTYSYVDLDSNNTVCSNQNISLPAGPTVAFNTALPLLKKNYNFGDSSEDIKRLQQFLRQEGFYMTRDITGTYGVVTDEALKNYRISKGISVELVDSSKAKCTQLINKTYQLWDESDEIGQLQQCLQDMGLFNWPTITNLFGNITQKGQAAAKQALGNNSTSTSPAPASNPNPPSNNQPENKPAPSDSCDSLKTQTYQFGENSSKVEKLQECMRQAGVFNWPYGNTGYFGPVTRDALAKWKGGQPAPAANYSCSDLKAQTWTTGETSERVKQLQTCMQQASIFNWPNGATSYFGDYTKQSLIKWRGYL